YGNTIPLLIIVPDEKDALRLDNAFADCGVRSMIYPLRDFVYHIITASHEYEHERLSVLSSVLGGKCDVVITTPDAALQYTIPPDILTSSSRTLKSDGSYDLEELCEFLTHSGYVRVEMVDGVGQFSVRGGIIDIFPPRAKNPIRMELFGDDVEQLGEFDVLTQRRTELLDEVLITPAREISLTAEKRAQLAEVVRQQLKKAPDIRVKDQLSAELEVLTSGTEASFLDKYISFIYDKPACLLDYFDNAPSAVLIENNAIAERVKSYEWHSRENISGMLSEQSIASKYAVYGKYQVDLDLFMYSRAAVMLDMFAPSTSGKGLGGLFSFATKQTVSYAESFDLLYEDVENYVNGGWRLTLVCETETAAKNTAAMLNEKGINAVNVTSTEIAPVPGTAVILSGINVGGYELVVSKYAVLSLYLNPMSLARSTNKKTGNVRKARRKNSNAGERIMAYTDLEVGDYVVHQNHGIGCYQGLMSLTNDGVTRDYVKIKYAGTDMLYLPINQLDMVSKYIGAKNDDGTVKLSKMGGTEWNKAKSRAKAAAKDMAKELIQLYAERLRKEGFAFGPDDEYQREFEAAFEYEETDGQLEAIEDIKRDMEKINPMDRLLCGDVGFGKTEVAIRAAFKAAANNKQTAILVPTTILAMQHYQTLLSRMRGFPIKIEMISRFRSAGQQAEILRRLRRGDVDIIVGTHRLVSSDIKFKDLGLVIIDEEQRFGV
nr:DEAD/DEAH box helicase [Clostridia bacterium]